MSGTRNTAIARRRKVVRRQKRLLLLAFMCLLIVIVSLCCSFIVNADFSDKEQRYKYYTDITVERGDTLWDIAQEYITDDYASVKEYIKEVRDINTLLDADQIYEGQSLLVPYYDTELKR